MHFFTATFHYSQNLRKYDRKGLKKVQILHQPDFFADRVAWIIREI